MTNKQTGGPAFGAHPESANWHPSWQGMTLRDYFAAKAMQGWLATYADDADVLTVGVSNVAKFSYQVADAMLKAREQ